MQLILIIVLALSSILVAIWFFLLLKSVQEGRVSAAYSVLLTNSLKIEELQQKAALKAEKLDSLDGIAFSLVKLFQGNSEPKKIAKLEKRSNIIRDGKISKAGIITLPGYVLCRSFEFIGKGKMYKTLQLRHIELYGKKNSEYRTNGVLAAMFSYVLIGPGITLAIGSLFTALNVEMIGPLLLFMGIVMPVLMAYSLYDAPRSKSLKRRDAIARQFPNVVSKLALLVCSGMIMDRAWNETANSNEGILYTEMKKTSSELGQNIAPEAAYSGFIIRCNTKETSKLASAILQNLSKGNAEIGNLLRDLAREAWQERRHLAKRDAEVANSKLLMPTMLLFISVLLMIAVPIAMMVGGAM